MEIGGKNGDKGRWGGRDIELVRGGVWRLGRPIVGSVRKRQRANKENSPGE